MKAQRFSFVDDRVRSVVYHTDEPVKVKPKIERKTTHMKVQGKFLKMSYEKMWDPEKNKWKYEPVAKKDDLAAMCVRFMNEYSKAGDQKGVERCKKVITALLGGVATEKVDVTEQMLTKSQRKRRRRKKNRLARLQKEFEAQTVESMLNEMKLEQ